MSLLSRRLPRAIANSVRWNCGVHLSPNPTPLQKWFRDKGDATLRIQYPLLGTSTVIDAGGFRGDWAQRVIELYDPFVFIFEPCHRFYERLCQRFMNNRKVKLLRYGLGGHNGSTRLALLDDGSSAFREAQEYEEVEIRDIAEAWTELGLNHCDLMKLNIEGGEYDLLARMLSVGMVGCCTDIQVQFHDLSPLAGERRARIRSELAATHYLTYDYAFVWENWRIRPPAPPGWPSGAARYLEGQPDPTLEGASFAPSLRTSP